MAVVVYPNPVVENDDGSVAYINAMVADIQNLKATAQTQDQVNALINAAFVNN